MAPAKLRGMLNIGFQLMITIGILAANLINYATAKIKGGWGWRISLGLAAVPAAIITLGSLLLPDTPNSLVERGHGEKARLMLRRIQGGVQMFISQVLDHRHATANLPRSSFR
ncbi:hypothetical protein C4D60_Mb05t00970 [Musa balbisiana]|uniref:Major facilitator superfamily (MFS) profile domain-containing protein n=1 Tax=Musa balbisiana TaxID=52838 RepID=A0A4S8JSS9_MUSBA|nr:hypothetical protein C4D60_Mb05t00970 [Musa balbisiana]